MPFKLTKVQTTEYNLLIENARMSLDTLNQSITDYNDAHEPTAEAPPADTLLTDRLEVQDAFNSYSTRIEELKAFAQRLSTEWRDDIDNRSDNWQDSDRGQAAEDFTSEWESYEPEPEPLDWDENPVPDFDGDEIDQFEDLPQELSL